MTDYMNANTINDLIRSIFALIDRVAYWLLGIMYEILFNVASADIFSNATIKNFYGRIQLILGVFMIFKLAISIIQGILNPDSFTDKKSGFGNIITRIITAIVLLAVLTPINIPAARNEYEIQLNNNGLLFGTLYSLQDRILENNTLGRLILGTTDNATAGSTSDGTVSGSDKQGERLAESADIFTSTILKGFVRINLKEKSQLNGQEPDETKASHRICENINQETLDAYTALDADPNQILSLVNASCEYEGGGFSDVLGFFKRLAGKDRYVFAYMPVVSTAVAVLFIYILLGEIITIAIRSIKLAVLRLIAPIPVISYIQPSKDGGAFGAWTKALISTYLELFLHLAVIYFVIFLIQDMIVNGIVINTGSGIIGIISMIFIWVGLFFFIRQAPKFIMNVLGVKGGGGSIGLAGLLAATGAIRQGGNMREMGEAFMDTTRAYSDAYNQGKAPPPLGMSYESGRDHVAKILTGDNNMTGRKMSRGARHLAAMGISTPQANRMKQTMYDREADANKAADLYDRFNKGAGHYTEAEIAAALGGSYSATDSDEVKRQKLYDHKVAENKRYTTAKSDYEDVKGMQKQYGQARSFEAKYDARRGNRSVASNHADGVYATYGATDDYGNQRYVDMPNRQRFRSQEYPKSSATSSTTPSDSSPGGVDFTPPGGTGSGGGPRGGGPGGHHH